MRANAARKSRGCCRARRLPQRRAHRRNGCWSEFSHQHPFVSSVVEKRREPRYRFSTTLETNGGSEVTR
ncbi:hypothetical protein D0Z70_08810 [Sphingobium terrigena]|uniref:Uncharacterized protein n=1 Tax=Sphingobium terrigena TaxID=2304063 RepID=A0A418YTV4_9SPHN|nr:hypothetical protein D0Z70_08810 [Sphingobium terrigena]